MAEDISRRIDDLLSGAIDEQVREQRALNDVMIGVRDGVSRLVGDVAALSARVTESRETSQGLREELPFLVQREVTSAVNALSTRIDGLETAVGELVASVAGLEDRVGADVIIDGVASRIDALRAAQEEQAGAVTAEAARSTVEHAAETLRAVFEDESAAMRSSFEQSAASIQEMVERNYSQVAKRLGESKKWSDDVEARMRALEKALEANVKLPTEVKKQLNELTGATQDMTDSVLEEIRINAEAGASRIAESVEGLDHEAIEMNRRFIEMNDRIATFQEQVLAYLQVRDLALEERRDQIVTELLADFLNEVPDRERANTVGRLRSVFSKRRDRRSDERSRGGAAGALPQVSAQAIAQAQADLVREQRLAERPWAEQGYAEPTQAPARPTASRVPEAEWEEPAAEAEQEAAESQDADAAGEYQEELPSPRARRAAASRKAAASKAAPKKKTAAKTAPKPATKTAAKPAAKAKPKSKPARSRTVPVPVAADVDPIPAPGTLDLSEVEFEDVEPVQISAVADGGEIDVVDIAAFAQPVEESDAPKAPTRKAKTAKPKPPPKAEEPKAEAPVAEDTLSSPEVGDLPSGSEADAAPPVPDAEAAPEAEDTLQVALARVQALVDQHRKPGAPKKR